MSDKVPDQNSNPEGNIDDLFKTTISPPPEAKSIDPHATEFLSLSDLKKVEEEAKAASAPADMHATTMMPKPVAPSQTETTPSTAPASTIPPTATASGPILSFIPRTIELGYVNKQTVNHTVLSVRNSGEGQLIGSIVPLVDWIEIEGDPQINCGPREIAKYTVKVKQGPTTVLSNIALLDLRTNAVNSPTGSMSVPANYSPAPMVEQGLTVLPDRINFPPVTAERLEAPVHATLTVANKSNESLDVTVSSSATWIQLSETRLQIPADTSVQLSISTRPSDVPGLAQSNAGNGTIQFVVEGKPQFNLERPVSLRVKKASDVQMARLLLWGEYLGLILFSAIGLSLAMRAIVLLVVFGHFSVIPVILGVIGAALPVGVFFGVLQKAPPLFGIEEKLDQIELDASGGTLIESIEEPRAAKGLWFFALAALIVGAGLLGGWLAFNQSLLVYDGKRLEDIKEAKDLGAAILGALGGLLVVILGSMSEKHTPFSGSSARPFDFKHLIRPIGAGVGLIAFGAGLGLIGANSWDLPLYILLALLGMLGLAGSSLRTMPLRLHQLTGRVQIAILSGVAAVAAMSLVSMVLDSRSFTSFSFRYSYKPAHFLLSAEDRNIVLFSLYGIPLVLAGLAGAWLVLQAFGYNLAKDKTQRDFALTVLKVSFGILLLPLLIVWLVLILLPLGNTTEGWLMWGIPFLVFLGEVWLIRERPETIDRLLMRVQGLVAAIPDSAAFIKKPLQELSAFRASLIQPLVDWKLGLVLAVVGSTITLPLLVSFWFWPLVFVAYYFVIDYLGKRKQSPSAPPVIPSEPTYTPPPSDQV